MPIFGFDKMGIHIVANTHHVLSREELHAKALRLLDDALSEFSPCNAFREARIIIESLGNASLSTQTATFDNQDIVTIAGGINRGSQTGGTTTNHDQIVEFALCFCVQAQLSCKFRVGWLDQQRAIVKYYGGDRQAAVLHFLYERLSFLVFLNVDVVVADTLFAKKFFAALAIATPIGAIEFDIRIWWHDGVFLSVMRNIM